MVSNEDIADELNLVIDNFYNADNNFNNADSTSRMRAQDEDSIREDIKNYILKEWV